MQSSKTTHQKKMRISLIQNESPNSLRPGSETAQLLGKMLCISSVNRRKKKRKINKKKKVCSFVRKLVTLKKQLLVAKLGPMFNEKNMWTKILCSIKTCWALWGWQYQGDTLVPLQNVVSSTRLLFIGHRYPWSNTYFF